MNFELQIRVLTIEAVLFRMLLAVVLGGVIGMERGLKNRASGFRTYMLVCLGSCAVMMTNQYVYQIYGTGDPVRMGAQVISGIGFLGAGTIIVTSRNQIKGLTTAAGLWAAACIGLAAGIGFYEIAVIGGICILLVLTLFHSWEAFMRQNVKVIVIYAELAPQKRLRDFLSSANKSGISISNVQIENNEVPGDASFCFVATARNREKEKKESFLQKIRAIPEVQYLEEL